MNKEAYGLVHDYFPLQKMISIKEDDGLSFFYFTKSLFKIFVKAMKHKNVFIHFEYNEDNNKVLKGCDAKQISLIHKISYSSLFGVVNVYNVNEIKEKVASQINESKYKMFMDFELTMPSYQDRGEFIPEILQIGAVISDENDNVVNEYSNYIRTNKPVSNRTRRFLCIDEEELSQQISIDEFYEDYKKLIEIYNPVVYVWGGNDTRALTDFYKMNNKPEIKAEYVDLLKLIRQYYELKEDVGLFNALKIFKEIDASQAHHALTDATATKEVFDSFKDSINGKNFVDLKKIREELKEEKQEREEVIDNKSTQE